jgi:hypothetical protein
MLRPRLLLALVVAALGVITPAPVAAQSRAPQARAAQAEAAEAGFQFAEPDERAFSRESVPALSAAPGAARAITPPTQPLNSLSRGAGKSAQSGGGWGTTLAALMFVVVLIVVGAKLWRSHGPAIARGLPREAVELLGKRYLDQRQCIHLVRCGARILILGSSPNGLHTLAEVTDPVEVDYLAGLCRQQHDDAPPLPFATLFKKQDPARHQPQRPEKSHA